MPSKVRSYQPSNPLSARIVLVRWLGAGRQSARRSYCSVAAEWRRKGAECAESGEIRWSKTFQTDGACWCYRQPSHWVVMGPLPSALALCASTSVSGWASVPSGPLTMKLLLGSCFFFSFAVCACPLVRGRLVSDALRFR